MDTWSLEPSALSMAPSDMRSTDAVPCRARILVIDDEPLVTRAVARVLCAGGFDVTVRNHPLEARDLLLGGARFDVILTDVMMPGLSGVELHRELLALLPEAARRMVFMTGGTTHQANEQYVAGVPNLCLLKPFAGARLLAVIDEALGAPGR